MLTGSVLYEKTDGSADLSSQNNYGNPLPFNSYPNVKTTSLNLKGTYNFNKNWSIDLRLRVPEVRLQRRRVHRLRLLAAVAQHHDRREHRNAAELPQRMERVPVVQRQHLLPDAEVLVGSAVAAAGEDEGRGSAAGAGRAAAAAAATAAPGAGPRRRRPPRRCRRSRSTRRCCSTSTRRI